MCTWSYSLLCPGILFTRKGKTEHVHRFHSVKKRGNFGQVISLSGVSISSSENGYNTWHVELLQGLTRIALLDGIQEAELNSD